MSKVLRLIESAKLPNGDRQWTQPPQTYYDAVLRTSMWGFPKDADYHVFTKFTFGLTDIIEAEALGFKIEYLGTGPYSFYSGAPEEIVPAHQQATWSKTAQENFGTLYLNGMCFGFVNVVSFNGNPLPGHQGDITVQRKRYPDNYIYEVVSYDAPLSNLQKWQVKIGNPYSYGTIEFLRAGGWNVVMA